MNRYWLVVCLLLACSLVELRAGAQVCEVPTDTSEAALQRIQVARLACFGGEADPDALSTRVFGLTTDEFCAPPDRTQLEMVREALADIVRDVDRDLLADGGTMPPPWTAPVAIVSGELRTAEATLRTTEGIAAPTYWQWSGTGHQAFQGTDGEFLLDYGPLVQNACTESPAGCRSAVAAAIELNRAVNLAAQANRCAVQSRLRDSADRLAVLDARWNSYFFQSRSQYIWELAVNGMRFEDKQDIFAEPPTDQLILLHPGPALEYVGTDPRNDRSYEAIVMTEVIGYNKLSWGARRLPPLGASLVVTHTPDNTGERSGYGVLFHVRNTFSFGATRRDTGVGKETTYLLSADLMRFLTGPSEERMKIFRGAGAPPSEPPPP